MKSTQLFSCYPIRLNLKSRLNWSILLTSAFAAVLIIVLNIELLQLPSRLPRNQSYSNANSPSCIKCPTLNQNCPSPAPARKSPHSLPNTEFYISVLNMKSNRRNDSFDPHINATELTVMMDLLWVFMEVCERHGVEVMLYGGSLLGSYRHHGFMPWDDDVDLLMKETDQKLLESIVLHNSTGLALAMAGRWKVWNKTACFHKAYTWCWPYLDLSFYRRHGDLIYDTVSAYGWNYSYPVSFTFPLHKRPFMGRWVDAPRDTLKFLAYDKTPTDQCISLYYSHKLEGSPTRPVMYASCASLSVTYPFVIRVPDTTAVSQGVLEVLRFHGGWPVYTVLVNEPPGAFNYDYTFLPVG